MVLSETDLMKIAKHAVVAVAEADSGAAVDELGEPIPYNKVRVVYRVRIENFGAAIRSVLLYLGDSASVKRKLIDTIKVAGDGSEYDHFIDIKTPIYTLRPYIQDTKATPSTAHQNTQPAVTYDDAISGSGATDLRIFVDYYDLPAR